MAEGEEAVAVAEDGGGEGPSADAGEPGDGEELFVVVGERL